MVEEKSSAYLLATAKTSAALRLIGTVALLKKKMPMNSNTVLLVDKVEGEEVVIKCPIQMTEDAVDVGDKPQSTSGVQQQGEKKKSRKSLTSFSIFRKDKKFSESKIEAPTKELPARSPRINLVLDNTRLEVGSISDTSIETMEKVEEGDYIRGRQ